MRVSILSAALLLAGSSAMAADIIQPAQRAAAVTSPAYNWTGFYAGVNAGYAFDGGSHATGGQTNYANTSGDTGTETHGPGGPSWATPANLKGFVGGGQVGYNWQASPWWVLGVETDFQGGSVKSASAASNTTAINLLPLPAAGGNLWPVTGNMAAAEQVDWYGTLRGRVGFTAPGSDLMLYGTGGLAYGQVRSSLCYSGGFLADAALGFGGSHWNGCASGSSVKVGWTAGGGLEYRLLGNWSAKVEYLFTDLGSATTNLSAPAFRNSNGTGGRTVSAINADEILFQTVRIGLNYHF